MHISDIIAGFICEMLDSEDGCAEFARAQLAARFNCVPSQISYVVATRFSPEHGYAVESRRGGGGYIRIRRVRQDRGQLVMHTVNAVGEQLSLHLAGAFLSNLAGAQAIGEGTVRLMQAAISPTALRAAPPSIRDALRASIFKQMLVELLAGDE